MPAFNSLIVAKLSSLAHLNAPEEVRTHSSCALESLFLLRNSKHSSHSHVSWIAVWLRPQTS